MPWKTNILVVANQTAGSSELLEALRARAGASHTAFTLVVPAGGVPGDHANRRLEVALTRMRREGLDVQGRTGVPDPVRHVEGSTDWLSSVDDRERAVASAAV